MIRSPEAEMHPAVFLDFRANGQLSRLNHVQLFKLPDLLLRHLAPSLLKTGKFLPSDDFPLAFSTSLHKTFLYLWHELFIWLASASQKIKL
jgi:hypothetical protein